MASAMTSLRLVMMSPTARSTSPRAGAGVRRQLANPRFSLSTARSTSRRSESGNCPITSPRSAGLLLSKYSPDSGATHFPPMKLLNFFMSISVFVDASASSAVLARKRISLDLLVKVRPRHLHRAGCFRDVPVELAQLVEEEGALGGVLELLEGATLGERRQARIIEGALACQAIDVARRDLRVRR